MPRPKAGPVYLCELGILNMQVCGETVLSRTQPTFSSEGPFFVVFVIFEVQLIYNVVLVSSIQQSDSVIWMY